MLNIRLIKGLSKPELSKHITPSLILGHDECMRGNNITAFILLEQLFTVVPSWLVQGLARTLSFSFCQMTQDLKILVEQMKWRDQVYMKYY